MAARLREEYLPFVCIDEPERERCDHCEQYKQPIALGQRSEQQRKVHFQEDERQQEQAGSYFQRERNLEVRHLVQSSTPARAPSAVLRNTAILFMEKSPSRSR